MAAASWRRSMAPLLERRTGPRKVALEPATRARDALWTPSLDGRAAGSRLATRSCAAPIPATPLPGERRRHRLCAGDAALALDRAASSSRSERLTSIYLRRIEQLDSQLRSVITLTRDLALEQAKRADAEIAAGRYRGPLHGIPYGVKDLLDTAGIATTYGAEPFRNRVPAADSAVVQRLNDAGAVLIAKLSLGALALNDIWFGGQTMNPWLLEEGASGSSAGPGAATAAALVGFSIGSETGGSIVAPAMRCGVTGSAPDLRPRAAHRRHDALLVARQARADDAQRRGRDARAAGDHRTRRRRRVERAEPSRVRCRRHPVNGLRVGYFPAWMKENPATDVDRAALDTVKTLGHDRRRRCVFPTGPTAR